MVAGTVSIPGTLESRRAVTKLLTAAALMVSGSAVAQDVEELRHLVFEPVPLSSGSDYPLDPDGESKIDRRGLLRSVNRYVDEIEKMRRSDPPDPEIVDQLGLLAVAYQDLGRHDEALEALDEAISLLRDEGGRDTIDQIPYQEQKIPSYLALDDIKRVDDTEELIYSLKEDNYGAGGRQMYYATINLADWNTTAYYRENFGAGNRVLQRQRGVVSRVQRCIAAPGRVNEDGSRACGENPIFSGGIKDVSDADINDIRLRKIDRLYSDYQQELIESGGVQLDIIIDLAKRVARLAFATKQEMDFERDNYVYDAIYEGSREQALRNSPARMNESYLTGQRALRNAIDFPTSVAGLRPEALAALQLDLGDWHLAYGKAAAAEEAYSEAYRVLSEAGFSSDNIDRALATPLPVQIPIFATHLYTRRSTGNSDDAELVYRGYLDVGYEVDSLGNASHVEILARSSEDSSEIQKLLELQLQSMKFRPVLKGGELMSPGRVEARYYYSY